MTEQPSRPPRRYRVEPYKGFSKDLARLPRTDQERVVAAVDALQANPRPHGVKKLKGRYNEWRIRVGDYRVIYTIIDDRLVVLLLKLGPRGGIYD